MSTRRRCVCWIMAVAILALGFLFLPPRAAEAMPEFEYTTIYYSNATYTTVVGSCFMSCTGMTCTGTITAYHIKEEGQQCPTPIPICSDSPWCDPRREICC